MRNINTYRTIERVNIRTQISIWHIHFCICGVGGGKYVYGYFSMYEIIQYYLPMGFNRNIMTICARSRDTQPKFHIV